MKISVYRTAPSPLDGEGWGGGSLRRRSLNTPLPITLRVIDLPLKGGEKAVESAR
jgi:hypothetical protein